LLALVAASPKETAMAQSLPAKLPADAGAIQVIADVTAIRARCWNLSVRPGIAFTYGETKGISMLEVLPGGRLRSAFDKALSDSQKIDSGQLCGPLASSYARDLPGVIESRYAAIGPETTVPYGWKDFCGRRPEECAVQPLPAVDLKSTLATWRVLDRINRQVNDSIEPVSNLDHWGTIRDHWDYPVDGKGDCKIYALYKRKLLMEAGFPRQALLMTIVRDLNGDGHAILTAKTDHGEFILDNLSDDIRPWYAPGYHFVKRQSQEDPNMWVSIGDSGKAVLYAPRYEAQNAIPMQPPSSEALFP
jgi:predicted transglutaminase-like cysteine proteinase